MRFVYRRVLLLVAALVLSPVAQAQADPMLLGLKALQTGDYASALIHLKPLAEAGDPKALYLLSELHGQGRGVALDTALALRQLTRSAEGGFAIAQFNLGNHYLRGDWVAKDAGKAAYWWRLAAGQGMTEAQYNLGSLYFHGLGVGQDLAQARFWYRQAAEAGSQRAREALAVMDDMQGSRLGMLIEDGSTPAAEQAKPAPMQTPTAPTSGSTDTAQADFSGLALGDEWVKAQAGTHYTLQLIASDKPAAVRRFLEGERFARQVAVYTFKRQDETWYGVLYGRFDSRQQAQAAIQELSPALQRQKPWVRSFANLQGQLTH